LDSFLQGSLFERCVAISDETHRFRDWPSDESGLSDAARSGPRVPTGLAQAAYELTWNSSNFWPGSASQGLITTARVTTCCTGAGGGADIEEGSSAMCSLVAFLEDNITFPSVDYSKDTP